MNRIVMTDEGLTLIREKVGPCSMTWAELRSIEGYRLEDAICLDFNSSLGGYFTADSDMQGYEGLLDALPRHLKMKGKSWREHLDGLSSGRHGGMIEIYEREETPEPDPLPASTPMGASEGNAARTFGPGDADLLIRRTLIACWGSLPASRRNPAALEREVRRLLDRALEDWQENLTRFGPST